MKSYISLAFLILITTLPAAWGDDDDRLLRRANRYFSPLPELMPGAEKDTSEQIALGKTLYFDKRLSINNSQSCASCHKLENGGAGVDNLTTSPGANGKLGTRNTPTVLNAGWQRRQFWDGRAADLVEQAKGPILNPIEMGMPDAQSLETKLKNIEQYRHDFALAWPEDKQPVTFQRVAEAIAAFERTLRSESRFDDFLRGNIGALSKQEKAGLKQFIKIDCVQCHDGALLGGEAFEKIGQEHAYENQTDQGLFDQTQDEEDRMVFKVASLRNIERTSPYFHDGRIKTLAQATRKMAKMQLDVELTPQQEKEILSFLKALSDKTSANSAQ